MSSTDSRIADRAFPRVTRPGRALMGERSAIGRITAAGRSRRRRDRLRPTTRLDAERRAGRLPVGRLLATASGYNGTGDVGGCVEVVDAELISLSNPAAGGTRVGQQGPRSAGGCTWLVASRAMSGDAAPLPHDVRQRGIRTPSSPRHLPNSPSGGCNADSGRAPRADSQRRGITMTYLNGPRLHFAGRFRADVSTVNNFVTHFDDPDHPPEPGWNPGGSGGWRLVDCAVTRAVYRDGGIAQSAAEDAVIGLLLSQIDSAVLVDLDPEQQLASQIWGLQLRLGGPGIQTAFRGAFKTTAFSDLWFARALVAGGGDFKMTAFFHSVLTGVAWGDPGGSRLLAELQADSDAGLLSMKFNVDGFDQRVHLGRIVGTIGPAGADEPAHFVRGRHCMPRVGNGPVWFFPSVVDTARGNWWPISAMRCTPPRSADRSTPHSIWRSACSPTTGSFRWAPCRSAPAAGTNRRPACANSPPTGH